MTDSLQRLLVQSFDRNLNEAEHNELEHALAGSAELRIERERLKSMRAAVAHNAEHSFAPYFDSRVMRKLAAAEDEMVRWLNIVFRKVALVGAIAALLLAGYNIIREENTVTLSSALAMPQPTLGQSLDLEITPE